MKIALTSNFLPGPESGGAERYAAMLATSLAQAGHEVSLYSGDGGELPGVACRRLPAMPRLSPSASRAGKIAWHLREQWLPAVHRELRRALEVDRPDVVHSHEPQLLSAAVFTAIAAADLPHVHTAHDFNLLCSRVTMTRKGKACGGSCAGCRLQRAIRLRAIRRRLDLLIAPSDFVRRRHLEYGALEPARALTIRHGAEAGRQRLREPRPGRLRLGFLGTLSAHKGVRTLLRAAASMPATWTLSFGGSGELAAEVAAAARSDSRIAYAGEVGEVDRDAFLDALDLIVIPSEWEEPATLVAVEAAVRGLPAVVSDRGGLPETAEAEVYAAGDSDALLGVLARMADRPETVTGHSAALLKANSVFLWPTHVRTVEAAIGRALDGD